MMVADDWPEPSYILEYYRRSLEGLGVFAKSVRTNANEDSRFFGMSEVELDEAFGELRSELDLQVTLLLTASFEATLQVDFIGRVNNRKRRAGKQCRKLWREAQNRGWRVQVEQILKIWKSEIGHSDAIGQFKQLIEFRHWLAHGRYWNQKSGLRTCDPFEAWSRAGAVFAILPEFDRLPVFESE
jgi:hypothetical protein